MKYLSSTLCLLLCLATALPAQAKFMDLFKSEKPKPIKRVIRKNTAKHPNGKTKSSYSVYTNLGNADLNHGPYQVYNLNGTLKEAGFYFDGILTRQTTYSWFGSGEKSQESAFEFDKKGRKVGAGKVLAWYLNAKPKKTWSYDKGVLVEKISYYGTGQKRYSKAFNEYGKPHGTHLAWYENGRKKSEFNFKDNKREGKFLEWNTTGVLTRNEVYKNDEITMRDGKKIVQRENTYNFGVGDAPITKEDNRRNAKN